MSVLADAIARGILAERPTVAAAPTCFACGRSYGRGAPKADGSGASRFCSTRCRDAYDAGMPPHEALRERYGLPVRGEGFLIECRGCRKPFVSKGLRCCSPECERRYREGEEIAKTMAEVGMESTGYVRRKCEICGGAIPRYTGVGMSRKETRKDARYCSKKCAQKAWRLSKSSRTDLRPIEAQESP